MKLIPAISRIVCGFVLLILAYSLYLSSHQRLSDGNEYGVQLFGYITSLSPSQAMLIYLGAGIVGIMFIAFGIISVLKRR